MIVYPLFSMFILLFSGYLAKRVRIISPNSAIVFLDFVLWFALPALIFDKVYHLNIDTTLISVIITGFFSSFFAAFVAISVGIMLKFTRPTLASIALLSLFGNTLFIGIPITQGLYGQSAINDVIFYDQIVTALPISILGPLILSFGAPTRVSIIQNSIKIIKFPPFIALSLALVLKNFNLPEIIFDPLRMFSNSVIPVALFAVGMKLGFNSIKSSYKSCSIVIGAKMILAPIIFLLIAKAFGFEINQKWIIGLIEVATPPMVLASAMILKANLDSNLAISAVAIGMIALFFTMPTLYLIAT
ncbi:MAG: AEC family transporter [Campylobacter sp.]|uniref:AEC family transporter n=1 Tax=Campylobacter sp. TaxID=205 RepID=UPI00259CB2C7|nr:AEC family transporter [Campylobacter sp.]MBQ8609877.1 AEC family transporter [Campylobacter sp.]